MNENNHIARDNESDDSSVRSADDGDIDLISDSRLRGMGHEDYKYTIDDGLWEGLSKYTNENGIWNNEQMNRYKRRHYHAESWDPAVGCLAGSLTVKEFVQLHQKVDEYIINEYGHEERINRARSPDSLEEEMLKYDALLRKGYENKIRAAASQKTIELAALCGQMDEPGALVEQIQKQLESYVAFALRKGTPSCVPYKVPPEGITAGHDDYAESDRLKLKKERERED